MITQFENGFITKSKLNEMVDGINANSEDIIDIKTKILTADVTKTVGIGGDFTTLNEAINWCKTLIPRDYEVTLQLMTGYIWTSNITIENCNLGFVTISSVDASVSATHTDGTFAFFSKNSISPKWNILLNCSGTSKYGLKLEKDSVIEIKDKKGILNSFQNILSFNSKIISEGTIYAYYGTGSAVYGVFELHDSDLFASVWCSNFILVSSNFYGNSIKCKNINFNGGKSFNSLSLYKESYSTAITVYIQNSSEILIAYSDSSIVDITASKGSTTIIESYMSGLVRNILASAGSNIFINSITFSGTASVTLGGIISANGSTGTLSQTANTITSNGIIFK